MVKEKSDSRIKKVIKRFYEGLDKKKNLFIVMANVYLILFYCFIYNDILETTRMGMAFWEKLFSGRIRYFYNDFFAMNPYAYTKEVQGVYDFPIYIVFAIWDLPLFLLDRFTNVDVFNNLLCLMWIKTMLLLFVALLVFAMNKLATTLGFDEKKTLLLDFLFLTSSFFMTSIIIDCAYDIVALVFAILGIEAWMRDDIKGFVAFFMCSIPLKFFSLLLFVPLLLLKEKNVLKIIGGGILSVLPILVFRILIPCSGNGSGIHITEMIHGTDLSNLALLYAITNLTHLAIGEIYFSVLGWVGLFAACYFLKFGNKNQYMKAGIYSCFLSYMVLFITCYSHPYWLLIMVPFMDFLIVMNIEYIHISLLLELVSSVAMIAAQIVVFPWCFGNAPASGMLIGSILGHSSKFSQYNLMTLVSKMAGEEAARKMGVGVGGMGSTIFVICIVLFAVINIPKEFKWKKYLINRGQQAEEWVNWLRIIAAVGIGLIPIMFYAIQP